MLYNMYSKWRQMGFLDINIIYKNSILRLNLKKFKQKVRFYGYFVTNMFRRVILKVSICRNVCSSLKAFDILKMECYD